MTGVGRTAAAAGALVCGLASDAWAQRPPWLREPYLRPAIYGRILDSVTQAPVARVGIGVAGQNGLSVSDSLGWYLRFDLRLGTTELLFYCSTLRRWGRQFASRRVDVVARTDSAVDFRLSLAGCEEPPVASSRIELRGYYRYGFETSDFEPCRQLPELAGTAYAGMPRSIWVQFAPGALQRAAAWPRESRGGNRRVFVRWRGTLTGPGSYGHAGYGMYELLVDEVLEVRHVGATDCR